MIKPNDVIEFIARRFPEDCNWLDGNCYYFALILKDRFNGKILYDVIDGHFVTEIDGIKYDYLGVVSIVTNTKHEYIEWDHFEDYDKFQKQRIISGCIT